jgi:glycerophosphoryl diester phosphodiesterase
MSDSLFSLDILIAHRGLQSRYPENTILALRKAIECGAKYIELDIQFSNDCLPVIYHDIDLQRVSAESGNVLHYPRHKLLQLPAYEPDRLGNSFKSEKISPLEALVTLLKTNPEVTAFVELKQESIAHCGRETMLSAVLNILEPVKQQVVIISYDYLLVQAARIKQWPRVGVVLEQWQDLYSEIVQKASSDYIFVDHEMIPEKINPEILNMAPLVAFEVGDKALANQLIDKGIAMLETYQLENFILEQKDLAKMKPFAT